MALRGVSPLPAGDAAAAKDSREKELHEIQQCERIVRFRDAVLAGNHPTFKPPPGVNAAAHSSRKSPKPTQTRFDSNAVRRGPRSPPNARRVNVEPQPAIRAGASTIATAQSVVSRPFMPSKTDINPIFLEKSHELVKAEMHLQRQRLERTLREEIEQRRVSKNAQTDQPSELDLSDVLAKALTLVQATSDPLPVDGTLTANNEAASDSFDDNSYYSSRHDTPESPLISRVSNESEHAAVPNPSVPDQLYIAKQNTGPSRDNLTRAAPEMPAVHPPRLFQNQQAASNNAAQTSLVPGLDNYLDGGNSSTGPSQNTSGAQSVYEDLGQVNPRGPGGNIPTKHAPPRPEDIYVDAHPPSPLIRSHAQAPPFAEAGRMPHTAHLDTAGPVGTPAQVVALRNEPVTITSPESSSQGGKASDKKKGKQKKKRKADRQAPEADVVPYIKPEPRSPSPMTAPSYIRPNKRQRYAPGQVNGPEYEELRYEPAPGINPQGPYPPRPYRDERIPIGYEAPPTYSHRAVSAAAAGGARYPAEYIDDGRGFIRHNPSPIASPYQYAPREAYPTRAVSQVVVNDPYRDAPRYRPAHEGAPLSVRPEADSYMGPPRPPPTRIIVDAFGREYIEPQPPAIRQSAAPPVRPGESEVIYERAPQRAATGFAGPTSYENAGVVYAGPSPYAMPRRYVTQPEYASQDYRDSRHGEYSTRPVALPGGDFVQVMGSQDRRPIEEAPREYATRAASTRPAEPVLYEGRAHAYGRVHSVRPEAPVREYAASVHPDGRREVVQPYMREYGGQPVRQPSFQQDYGVMQPIPQYHNPQPPGPGEIAFIERPRGATQEIVYADDARREVYR